MDLGTMVSVLSIVVAAAAFIFNIITNYKSAVRARKQATLDAFNALQNQALDELNSYPTNEIEEIIKDKHSENYKNLSKCIARIEHFCVGVEEEIYDFNTLYKLAHGYFEDTVYNKLLPIIERKDSDQYEDVYLNFKRVVARMKNKNKYHDKT